MRIFGWNYLKGPWLSGIRYWQKKDDDQNEIFSDRQSKDNHYKKINEFFILVGYAVFSLFLYVLQGFGVIS